MKKVLILNVALFLCLFCIDILAQDTIKVSPGYGTLNDAITANGGNKVYKLQAGGWYGLNAELETPNQPIEIIGELPASDKDTPAQIQVGTSSDGSTFQYMFNITGNVTMKHVWIIDADLNNTVGQWTFYQTASARVVFDSMLVDPVGWQSLLNTNEVTKETYITNSIFLRCGNTTSPWEGWFFHSYGSGSAAWDTLYFENNTVANVPLFLFQAENYAQGQNNFIWFNHNTILYAKAELKYSFITQSDFFTNNLLWQGGYDPFVNTWNESRPDGSDHILTSLICTDTLVGETLPSQRKSFIEYNFNSIDSRINEDIQLAAANNQTAYLRPFVMPSSMSDSSREAQMFSDKTNFPHLLTGNNIEYIPNSSPYSVSSSSFIDPEFSDSTIYAFTDSAVAWKACSFREELGLSDYPVASSWPNILFTKEADGHNEGNPTVWPRINGAYTNSDLLSASIEKLPLGDLNWFPEKKAIWEAHKTEIMQHILSQNESQLSVTSVKQTNNLTPSKFEISQNYPNPFNPSTTIKYSIPQSGLVTLKVYNVLGQEVANLVNQVQKSGSYTVNFNASKLASGVYMYKIQAGDYSQTKKMMLLK
jgi:hypothetical protein